MFSQKILIVSIIIILFISPLASPAHAADDTSYTFVDFKYADRTAQTMYGSLTYFIPLPQDWAISDGAQLEVILSHSPLLRADRSTVTVFINDVAYGSALLDKSNQEQGRFIVPFKVDAKNPPTGLSIRFAFFMRLSTYDCEEINNPALWAIVHKESNLKLPHTRRAITPDLAKLNDTLFPQNQITPDPLIFVLPDMPNASVLTTAGMVAARLGNIAAGRLPVIQTAINPNDEQLKTSSLIYVGKPSPINSLQPPAGEGAIQITQSSFNPGRAILSLSGDLNKAALAFSDLNTFQSLNGTSLFVRGVQQRISPVVPPAWTTGTTTFLQMNDRDRRNTGFGTFEEFYFFRRPAGWVLNGNASVTINVDTTPALRSQESSITVYANDAFAGAARIGAGIEQNSFTFTLPVNAINQSADGSRTLDLILRVVVTQYSEFSGCVQSHPESIVTNLRLTSSLTTPHSYASLPDLREYPYPFVSDTKPAPTALIVPDQPTSPELSTALMIATQLGRHMIIPLDLKIMTSNELTDDIRSSHHLIVINSGSRQPFVKTLNEQLPAIKSLTDPFGVYNSAQPEAKAYIREAASPWNKDRVVLLINAESPEAFIKLSKLIENVPSVSDSGSVAVLTSASRLQVIYRSTDAAPSIVPEVQREPLAPKLEPWQVILIVIVLTVIGVVAVVAFSNWRAAKR